MRKAARAGIIACGAARLTSAGIPGAERDARLLYRWAAGMDGPALAAALAEPAAAHEIARFEHGIAARERRVPLSQITGERLFWGRGFKVTHDVLDPRPETETLIAHALYGTPVRRILDLGTGSGCILLTLLCEWPEATGLGVDSSMAALSVAAENACALGVAERAAFRHGDWCDGLEGPFDLLISNPPYVTESELADLAPEIRLYEPRTALAGGVDGLEAYRRIAGGAGRLLAPGGRVVVEIGPAQGTIVAAMFAEARLGIPQILPDMDGRDRVISVSHPKNIA